MSQPRWQRRIIQQHEDAQRAGLLAAERRGHRFLTPRRWDDTSRCINDGCHGRVGPATHADKRVRPVGNALDVDCPAPDPGNPWDRQQP